jgi:hypothetical protein
MLRAHDGRTLRGCRFSLQIPNLQEPPGVVGEQNASTNSNPLFLLVHAR